MYYILFVAITILSQVNSVYLYKKYQLTAGTTFRSNVLYMLINRVVSAVLPAVILYASGSALQITP